MAPTQNSVRQVRTPRRAVRSGRIGAAMGLVWFVALWVGGSMSNAGWSSSTDGPSILANFRRPPSAVNVVGVVLELLSFAALAFFIGYVYRILRTAEGQDAWLAPTALLAGAVTLAIKLGSAAPIYAAFVRRDQLTPDMARTLVDINDGAFVVTGFTFAIFVLAASASALGGRALPTWLCWVGLVAGVPGLVTPAIAVYNMDAYVPVPYLVGTLWVAATSVVLVLRERRAHRRPVDEAAQTPASDMAVAATAGRS